MIIPEDDEHDFTPVEAPFITVGQEIVVMAETDGEITFLDEPTSGFWVFALDGAEFGFFEDAASPSAPWTTTYLYRRLPKPAQGAKFTAADSSRWVYPAQPHGLYRCWQAGTTHGEGLAARAEIEGLVED